MKKFKHLIALAAVIFGAIALAMLGCPAVMCVALVGCYQLAQLGMSKRHAMCMTSVLSPEQIKEFENILGEFKDIGKHLPGIKQLSEVEGGFAWLKSLPELFKTEQKRNDELDAIVKKLTKRLANEQKGIIVKNGLGYVTEECANFLGSMFVVKAVQDGKIKGVMGEALLAKAAGLLGMETKAAVATTDIPLPVAYGQQIAELVYMYGTARKECTVYPLSGNSQKLPRLKTGEPQFAFINVSGSVTEKVPQSEWVTFTPGKAGGIVRLPSEIEEDSIFDIGQFVARYIARQMAYWEDYCLFQSDGTSTYNSIASIGTQSDTDSVTLTLASTKTHPSDITLSDVRNLRSKVTGAVLQTAKYYAHPSMEALFVSFNTSATVTPYIRNGAVATLDGFPIVWTAAMPVYTTSATVSAFQLYFGDLSWWYMGVRRDLDVQTSRDVYFATDEVGIRALERFDIHQMGQKSTAAIKLAAS
jgi:HK97 family phage major capsid protein